MRNDHAQQVPQFGKALEVCGQSQSYGAVLWADRNGGQEQSSCMSNDGEFSDGLSSPTIKEARRATHGR